VFLPALQAQTEARLTSPTHPRCLKLARPSTIAHIAHITHNSIQPAHCIWQTLSLPPLLFTCDSDRCRQGCISTLTHCPAQPFHTALLPDPHLAPPPPHLPPSQHLSCDTYSCYVTTGPPPNAHSLTGTTAPQRLPWPTPPIPLVLHRPLTLMRDSTSLQDKAAPQLIS
jgi:hypothetical protein